MIYLLLACAQESALKQNEQLNVKTSASRGSEITKSEEKPSSDISKSKDPVWDELQKEALNGDGGIALLAELCDDIGHRLSGSAQLEEAVIWAQEKMKSYAFENVHAQPVLVPNWTRGEESLTLTAPKSVELPMLGLGMSVGTSGLEAEVLVVSSFDELAQLDPLDVKGKMILYNAPFTTYGETVQYRTRGPSKAAEKGAVGVLVRSVGPSSLQSPHTGATSYQDGLEIPAAAVTIETAEQMARWQKRGKKIRVKLRMEALLGKDAPSANVIGEIRGSERPDEVVVIGGHLDSWDVGQGAQDDGAGVAIVMEAARLIASLDKKPKRTLRVVLFTNEENGLAGAKGYAQEYPDRDKHIAGVEADIGGGRPAHFNYKLPEPYLYEEELLEGLSSMTDQLQGLGMDEFQAGYAGADINPLVQRGVLGFGLRMDSSGYWPIHHTHADTLDKIDPENMKKNIAAMAILSWGLLNMDLPQ